MRHTKHKKQIMKTINTIPYDRPFNSLTIMNMMLDTKFHPTKARVAWALHELRVAGKLEIVEMNNHARTYVKRSETNGA